MLNQMSTTTLIVGTWVKHTRHDGVIGTNRSMLIIATTKHAIFVIIQNNDLYISNYQSLLYFFSYFVYLQTLSLKTCDVMLILLHKLAINACDKLLWMFNL